MKSYLPIQYIIQPKGGAVKARIRAMEIKDFGMDLMKVGFS
jgi:hypothetical protein